MRNIKEIIGNTMVIGGMLTAGGAAVDGVANNGFKSFLNESGQRSTVFEDVRHKYNVLVVCGGMFGNGAPNCYEVVNSGESPEERSEIYTAYEQELSDRLDQIPHNVRADLDVLGVVAGLSLMSGGVTVRKQDKKE